MALCESACAALAPLPPPPQPPAEAATFACLSVSPLRTMRAHLLAFDATRAAAGRNTMQPFDHHCDKLLRAAADAGGGGALKLVRRLLVRVSLLFDEAEIAHVPVPRRRPLLERRCGGDSSAAIAVSISAPATATTKTTTKATTTSMAPATRQ